MQESDVKIIGKQLLEDLANTWQKQLTDPRNLTQIPNIAIF